MTRHCSSDAIDPEHTPLIMAGAEYAFTTVDLTSADLTGCRIFGVSAWRLKLDGTKQQNLIITPSNEPEITVDNIEVAQFIYLLLHNEKIRDVTIGPRPDRSALRPRGALPLVPLGGITRQAAKRSYADEIEVS
jgi:hypothetical protein